MRTPLAGDFVTAQCRLYFEEQGLELVPPYLIATKVGVVIATKVGVAHL